MFKQGIITAYGEALEAKVRTGQTTIVFTKLAMGDGEYTGDVRELRALKSEKQRFGISSITSSDASTVRLRTVINNNGMISGYYIREIGVYALDPDVGEILYSVIQGVEDKLDYQPSESEFDKATMTLDIFVQTVSADTAAIMTGSGAAASAEDLAELKKKLDAWIASTGRVLVGPETTPLNNNDTLFIADEPIIAFSGVSYDNMVFSANGPVSGENWAELPITEGKLAVSEEAPPDTAFFAKIEEGEQ